MSLEIDLTDHHHSQKLGLTINAFYFWKKNILQKTNGFNYFDENQVLELIFLFSEAINDLFMLKYIL